MSLLDQLSGRLGAAIERRPAPSPNIVKVETAIAIGRIFDADAERQKLDHNIAMRGGPRIANNSAGLGRNGPGFLRTLTDWLH